MLLQALVSTSAVVAATRSRLEKRDALAALLGAAAPADVEIVVSYLAGELRQRRTGIGWAALKVLPEPAAEPSLTIIEVDAELDRISRLAGPGSAAARTAAVHDLFGRATAAEQQFLRRLIAGEIRQGALDSTMVDALALASGVAPAQLRRAVMLAGATGPVAIAALTGGVAAVAVFTLRVGDPIRPMLASSAPDVLAAMDKLGAGKQVCVDTKLDGIRLQAHKSGSEVRLFTRSLDDITDRLPEVVAVVRALPAGPLVLDGEVIALGPGGRPRPFQETASRTAAGVSEPTATEPTATAPTAVPPAGTDLSVFFFDCLVWAGIDLIDEPLSARLAALASGVPAQRCSSRLITADAAAATAFFAAAVAAGQEGVVVKDLDAPYAAGRRGSGWIKVKPRHTLDLVVLAVEEGSGRRTGLLSNIHLGARDPDRPGEFVMLGKTFKGMTDEMLAWQTERFGELAEHRAGHVVTLRPEQVVEVAFDGVQRSSRYPGGFALRFARVLRYRADKTAAAADTIQQVRALAEWYAPPGSGPGAGPAPAEPGDEAQA